MAFNWIKSLKKGLEKSSNKLGDGIKSILKNKRIDESTLQQIEEVLILSDIGISFSNKIIDRLRKIKLSETGVSSVKSEINSLIIEILEPLEKKIKITKKPYVFLIVGVNGVGKTATVGKLAYKFSQEKKTVGIVAADTFRAAAVEQLEIWSKKTGSVFFSGKSRMDPASLSYSSYLKAREKNLDVLIIDTAGRLHNKINLMEELSKIIRVLKKIDEHLPNEITLILDGNTGQNSIKQAQTFKEICSIQSLIITKLDGTAKGGTLVPIGEQLGIPIISLGVGEKKEDLVDFDAKEFSKALLGL